MKKLIIALLLAIIVIWFANICILEHNWWTYKADKTIEYPTVRFKYHYQPIKTGYYDISHYSELDSCHYPTPEGCLTASGKIAEVGMVATNLFPFGTKLEIDGLIYTVEDRISTRYNERIDIWVGHGQRAHEQAKRLGVKNKLVIVK